MVRRTRDNIAMKTWANTYHAGFSNNKYQIWRRITY